MANLSKHYLPFSMQPNVQQQSGKFINVIILFILIGILLDFIGLVAISFCTLHFNAYTFN
jgi:hypothetical protein